MTYRLFIYRDSAPGVQHETCETYSTLVEATRRCAELLPAKPRRYAALPDMGLPFSASLSSDGEIAQMSLSLPRGGGDADTPNRREWFGMHFEPFNGLQGFTIQREDHAVIGERERMFEGNSPARDAEGKQAFNYYGVRSFKQAERLANYNRVPPKTDNGDL